MTTVFNSSAPQVTLLVGPPRSGKTTLVQHLISLTGPRSKKMAGILTPGIWSNGTRNAFNIQDVITGKTEPLAKRQTQRKTFSGSPFLYDPAAVDMGKSALSTSACEDADIVLVDEVGQRELNGEGWAPCLSPLLSIPGKKHLWIVQERLAHRVLRIWKMSSYQIIHITSPDAESELLATLS